MKKLKKEISKLGSSTFMLLIIPFVLVLLFFLAQLGDRRLDSFFDLRFIIITILLIGLGAGLFSSYSMMHFEVKQNLKDLNFAFLMRTITWVSLFLILLFANYFIYFYP